MIPASDAPANQTADARQSGLRWIMVAACAWFLLAVALLVFLYSRVWNMTLDGDLHGWASANCMTQARSFLNLGPWRTHFVPVQNNPPLGRDPDVYLHWPPLVPLVISWSMRVFGQREAAGRIVELMVSLLTAGLLAALGKILYNLRVGMLAGFFFLTAPAIYDGGRVIVQPPMAMMFAVAAVFFYALAVRSEKWRRGWTVAGVFCVAAMVLASWDPLFMPLGLLLAAIYLRDRPRIHLAAVYLAAAVLTFVAIQADYILSYPALFADEVATIGYRMGLPFKAPSTVRLHGIVDQVGYKIQYSATTSFVNQISTLLRSFSPFILLGGCLFLAFWWQSTLRRDRTRLLVIGGLAFPWILWAIVMRQYMGIHAFTLVLAAPFLTLATALIVDEVLERLNRREWQAARWVVVLILPALVFHGAFQSAVHAKERFAKPEFGDLSALIKKETPPNAVVLSPEEFSEPVYYSQRHIVRGVDSTALLEQAINQAHAAFPGSPLYLAVRTTSRDTGGAGSSNELGPALAAMKPAATLGGAAIYKLP